MNNYISSFNSGILSDYLDSRIDVPKYQSGCKRLTNAFVRSTGGAERRSGTEYIGESYENVRLIPFNFSEDDAFIMEFTNAQLRVFDGEGYADVTLVTPFDDDDLPSLQYERVFDLLFITCPNKPTQIVKRTHLSPLTFTISNIEFDYPPLFDRNTDRTYTFSCSVTDNNTTGDLVATEDTFSSEHVGSQWLIQHDRDSTNSSVNSTETGSDNSDPLDVSFDSWTISTDGIWNGYLVIQKSYDDGYTWENVTIMADTRNSDANNFIIDSTGNEGANTQVRLSILVTDGTLSYNISTDAIEWSGLVTIVAVTDAKNATARVDSKLASTAATYKWSEGAFSSYRGYPRTVEYFEERIIFSGTKTELNKVYMSVAGDYFNFQPTSADDGAVNFQPTSPEQTSWTISKDKLFIGTEGSTLKVYSIDDTLAISNSTVKSDEELAYGCEPIQSILTNEVVVYAQRQGHKLRELVFDDNQQGYVSQDLTILSSNVTESGVTEMTLSKTPDQIVWCLLGNGNLAGMTYERSEGISGWHEHEFGGTVKSLAVKRADGEDELWMVIERDGGFYLERTTPRLLTDNLLDAWYVDSGLKTVLTPLNSGSIYLNSDSTMTFTSPSHGLNDDDLIRISNSDFEEINDEVYEVVNATIDTFVLGSKGGMSNVDWGYWTNPDTVTLSGSDYGGIDGSYTRAEGSDVWYQNSGINGITRVNGVWSIIDYDHGPTVFINPSTTAAIPESGWVEDYPSGGIAPTLSWDVPFERDFSGDFIEVSNTWDNLEHLEGETVQVQGDGGFVGEYVVEIGTITTDDYYNQTIIGLQFITLVQPMYLEPDVVMMGKLKKLNKASIKFKRTIGAVIGTIAAEERAPVIEISEFTDTDKVYQHPYNVEQLSFRTTSDNASESIIPFTGEIMVYTENNYERLKSLFIVQNLPHPMTVLSMAVTMDTGR